MMMKLQRTRYDEEFPNDELYSEQDIFEVVKEIIENQQISLLKDDENNENLKKNIKFKHSSSISFNKIKDPLDIFKPKDNNGLLGTLLASGLLSSLLENVIDDLLDDLLEDDEYDLDDDKKKKKKNTRNRVQLLKKSSMGKRNARLMNRLRVGTQSRINTLKRIKDIKSLSDIARLAMRNPTLARIGVAVGGRVLPLAGNLLKPLGVGALLALAGYAGYKLGMALDLSGKVDKLTNWLSGGKYPYLIDFIGAIADGSAFSDLGDWIKVKTVDILSNAHEWLKNQINTIASKLTAGIIGGADIGGADTTTTANVTSSYDVNTAKHQGGTNTYTITHKDKDGKDQTYMMTMRDGDVFSKDKIKLKDKNGNDVAGAEIAEDVVENMKNTYSQAMLNSGYGTKSSNDGKVNVNNSLDKPKIDVINRLNNKEYYRGKDELNLSSEEYIKRQNDMMIASVSDDMLDDIDKYKLTAHKRVVYVNEKGESLRLELNSKIHPEKDKLYPYSSFTTTATSKSDIKNLKKLFIARSIIDENSRLSASVYTDKKGQHTDIKPNNDNKNTAVIANQDMKVMNVLKDTTNTKDYNSGGNTVLAKTKDNQNYIFSHLDDVYVKTGDSLVANSPIGKIGNTGSAIGSNMDKHLHIQSIPVNITNAKDVIATARTINNIVSDDDLGGIGDDVIASNMNLPVHKNIIPNVGIGNVDKSKMVNTNADLNNGFILMPRTAENNIGLNSVLTNPLYV